MVKKVVEVKNPFVLCDIFAGLFCQTAMKFKSQIFFEKQGLNGDINVNAKSLLSVLGSCIKSGDKICITCKGDDEQEALHAMVQFVETGLEEY